MADFAIRGIVRSRLTTARLHGQLMRKLLRLAMVRHLRVTLAKHFLEGAQNVYHYERRREKYLKAKNKRWHHQKPLVWTGRTRDQLQARSVITATQHQSRLLFKNYFPLSAQRRREIEVILKREEAEIAKTVLAQYIKAVKTPAYQAVRRLRG
jgi:hypothetical protein